MTDPHSFTHLAVKLFLSVVGLSFGMHCDHGEM